MEEPDADLIYTTVMQDRFVLACRRDHLLAGGGPVPWEALTDMPVVTLGSRSGTSRLLYAQLPKARNNLAWRYEVQHLSTKMAFIEAGLGVGIIPEMSMQPNAGGGRRPGLPPAGRPRPRAQYRHRRAPRRDIVAGGDERSRARWSTRSGRGKRARTVQRSGGRLVDRSVRMDSRIKPASDGKILIPKVKSSLPDLFRQATAGRAVHPPLALMLSLSKHEVARRPARAHPSTGSG